MGELKLFLNNDEKEGRQADRIITFSAQIQRNNGIGGIKTLNGRPYNGKGR